ncbi:MAG: pantoate--beta-alanine ligase [Acidobacteria bacterium]|nr:pantoate--beta-alanine ligase [Acidobacteriota bacterium]
MRVTESLEELRDSRRSLRGSFGLVPTMGALHEGHASLVRRAREECDAVGVSIFVNPAQFGPGEDLAAYPRPIGRDLELLEGLGADLVWTPAAASLYGPGYQTWVTVEEITRPLEGGCRPGHFRGVATVVAKLLNAFTPDRAYFGQKDAQQVAVIRRMVRDLDFAIEVVVCPTVREPDGLALSSRNAYLGAAERRAAAVLYRALAAARARYDAGERAGEALRAAMREELRSEPLAREEYVSVADPETLLELDRVEGGGLLSLAVRIGRTRLIDNLTLERRGR